MNGNFDRIDHDLDPILPERGMGFSHVAREVHIDGSTIGTRARETIVPKTGVRFTTCLISFPAICSIISTHTKVSASWVRNHCPLQQCFLSRLSKTRHPKLQFCHDQFQPPDNQSSGFSAPTKNYAKVYLCYCPRAAQDPYVSVHLRRSGLCDSVMLFQVDRTSGLSDSKY